MSDLADFLLARIAEDEDQARTFLADNHAALVRAGLPFRDSAMSFVIRVLAECDAKRRIVEHYLRAVEADDRDKRRVMAGGYPHPEAALLGKRDVSALEPVVRLLALPYADHPDYRDEWRP